jgi:transposase
LVSSSVQSAIKFRLSGGENGDAAEGRKLVKITGRQKKPKYLLMDKAYEGNETRKLAKKLGCGSIVPPKSNRKKPWIYDKISHKKRSDVERLFLRIKRFCCVFTRYDKLDLIFKNFIFLALIVDALF